MNIFGIINFDILKKFDKVPTFHNDLFKRRVRIVYFQVFPETMNLNMY